MIKRPHARAMRKVPHEHPIHLIFVHIDIDHVRVHIDSPHHRDDSFEPTILAFPTLTEEFVQANFIKALLEPVANSGHKF